MNLKHQKLIVTKTLSLVITLIVSVSFVRAQTSYGTPVGTPGQYGTFIGEEAGLNSTILIKDYNTFIGHWSGKNNTTGKVNTYVGAFTGSTSSTGTYNSCFGVNAGRNITSGGQNTFLGVNAGNQTTQGRFNTYVGLNSGLKNTTGEFNVFLGSWAGYFNTESNKLIIDTKTGWGDKHSPLIYGDFVQHYVGIAINPTTDIQNPTLYGLYVGKGILTEKVKIALRTDTANWSDYVFEENYDLNTTEEVESFIEENGHLPNVPSAEEVGKNGIDVVEMDATLLRQIEELWLHVIELKKENEALKKEMEVLKK